MNQDRKLVYILIDDAPEDFGGHKILDVYYDHDKAHEEMKKLHKMDHYLYQYLHVRSYRVK